jgi:hypothetical protein
MRAGPAAVRASIAPPHAADMRTGRLDTGVSSPRLTFRVVVWHLSTVVQTAVAELFAAALPA